MSRLRPVHQLSEKEAQLQAAVLQPGVPLDHCDELGAHRLKARIEAFWRERGHDVEIKVIESGFVAPMRSARFDLRSNMVNGMPREPQPQQGDAAE